MYPTQEEFKELLRTGNLDDVIEDHLFTGLPFSFSDRPDVYQQMVRAISRGLKVPRQDICVVGSARLGFSLSPYKFGALFNQYSDLDIIVVSSLLFDPSWMDILTNQRARWSSLKQSTKDHLQEHREKDHIYNGWIYPSLVAEALDIGQPWLTTFNGLSRIPELSSRPINGRLYRTWEHARVYHQRGLRQIRTRRLASSAAG